MPRTEEAIEGVCCLLIIIVAGIYLMWYYYGPIPFALLLIGGGTIILLLVRRSRQKKKEMEEVAGRETLKKLEERIKEKEFEKQQIAKGLVKFTDEDGNIQWGTPEQVREWKRAEKVTKETVVMREIVKIRCRYCGKLFDERLDNCPHCGGG
jgi:hypothetical protein